MMKKLIVAILALLYISTSAGATVHLHYCMGKLVNWSLWHDKDGDNCGKCGMSKSNKLNKGCCKDEHKLVKLEKDQRVRENIQPFAPLMVAVLPPVFSPVQNTTLINSTAVSYPVSHAPPGYNGQQTYLLLCTFRI
ncbi:MAG: hypothetical protein QM731_09985 [Chitinophagaceae bacterium]